MRLRRAISDQTTFGVRYVHDEVDNGASRFAFIEGSRDWLELELDRRGDHGRVTLAYAFETHDRADPGVSPTRNRLSLRYRHTFSDAWSADLGAAWRMSRYRDMAEPRKEDLLEFSGAVTRYLSRGWQIQGVLALVENDANAAVYDYQRTRWSAGIAKLFQ